MAANIQCNKHDKGNMCTYDISETPKRLLLVNSEGPGVMPQNALFHQGLLCLLSVEIFQGL